ncbi:MAG TPA: tetratricopeptide repeat protein [Acidobacteriota bacterium]|nr:tetratricopeptide repeat protein [Acidobacteriota bacterium]
MAETPSIEKLLRKIEKEPTSLLFLQLADEYRKEKMYEDALQVCWEGLRRHPNYWSARVTVGRIYREVGENDKSSEELEKVVKAVPDNLMANRILADIYMEQQRYADALKRYKIVQMITPADQVVVANIRKIESGAASSAQARATIIEPSPVPEPKPAAQPVTTVSMPVPEEPKPAPTIVEVPETLEKTDPRVKIPEITIMEPDAASSAPTQLISVPSWEPSNPEEAAFDSGVVEELMNHPEIDPFETESAHQPEYPITKRPVSLKSLDQTDPALATGEELDFQSEDLEQPKAKGEDSTQPMKDKEEAKESEEAVDELTTQTLAELYVQQGLIDKAVRVYQKLLLHDPTNTQIIGRLKELSPADALLTAAARNERTKQARSKEEPAGVDARNLQQISEDRRRKINTLESWLNTIRRERI